MRLILTHRLKTKSATNLKVDKGLCPRASRSPRVILAKRKHQGDMFLLALNIPEREAAPRIRRYFPRPT